MEDITYKYDAFISYRHYPKDMKIAQKLQKMLEGDIIPAKSGIDQLRKEGCAYAVTKMNFQWEAAYMKRFM